MRTLPAEASLPPLQAETGGERDFDTNMVVILAALLTALICALGLNSMVRCALRCSGRGGGDAEEEGVARRRTGLRRSALRQIPVTAYGVGEEDEEEACGAECPICLAEFEEGEKVRVLPRCGHGFHVRCIDTWLEAHASCPTCRRCPVDKKGRVKLPDLRRESMVGPIDSIYL